VHYHGNNRPDGFLPCELLMKKGYEVHGLIRRSHPSIRDGSTISTADPQRDRVRLLLHYGDLNDASSLNRVLARVKPDEIYNLGAQSHVRVSSTYPSTPARWTRSARCASWKRSAKQP